LAISKLFVIYKHFICFFNINLGIQNINNIDYIFNSKD